MKQQLSDLMDGELDVAHHDKAWTSLSSDDELRNCWHTYHLIGDCMRGEALTDSAVRPASAEKIMARLAQEPTVLAPRRKFKDSIVSGKTRVALAMAASVATLSVVGIIASRQADVGVAPTQLAQQQPATSLIAQPAPLDPAAGLTHVNDYLVLHRQFSNPDAIQQANMVREGRLQRQGPPR